MKLFFAIASTAMIVISCNSGKSKDDNKETGNKDTAVTLAPDSINHNSQKDTVAPKEAGLGGVGDLTLDLSNTKTIELLGQPGSKSKAEEWGADGLMHQDWVYKSKGITLNMAGNKDMKDQKISSITITAPCSFKTKNDMGIGSMYKEVMAAYENDIDKSFTDKATITVGSVYGGIIFSFKNDKVEKVFIGAAAE